MNILKAGVPKQTL